MNKRGTTYLFLLIVLIAVFYLANVSYSYEFMVLTGQQQSRGGGISFSGDSKYIATYGFREVVIFNGDTGEEVEKLNFPSYEIRSLGFSRDGKKLVITEGTRYRARVFVYDLDKGKTKEIFNRNSEKHLIAAIDWHNDALFTDKNGYIVTIRKDELYFFDYNNYDLLHKFVFNKDISREIYAISEDNKYIFQVASSYKKIKISKLMGSDSESYELYISQKAPEKEKNIPVIISNNRGDFFSFYIDSVGLNLLTKYFKNKLSLPVNIPNKIISINKLTNDFLLERNGKLSIMSNGVHNELTSIKYDRNSLYGFLPNGKSLIIVNPGGHLSVHDINTGIVKESAPFAMAGKRTITTSNDKYLVEIYNSGVIVWDLHLAKLLFNITFEDDSNKYDIKVSTDNKKLYVHTKSNVLKAYSLDSGEIHNTINDVIAFSNDGFYAIKEHNKIKIFSIQTGDKVFQTNDIDYDVLMSNSGLILYKLINHKHDKKTKKYGSLDILKINLKNNTSQNKHIDFIGREGYFSIPDKIKITSDGGLFYTLRVSRGSDLNTSYVSFYDPETLRKIKSLVIAGNRTDITFKKSKNTVNITARGPAYDRNNHILLTFDLASKFYSNNLGETIPSLKLKHKEAFNSFESNENLYVTYGVDGVVKVFQFETNNILCNLVVYEDGEWVIFTPEGFFNASPNGAKYLRLKNGKDEFLIDQFYDKLYRPDLVQAKLTGDPEGLVAEAASKWQGGDVLK